MNDKIKKLITSMTLEEKASLCSGEDFWNLKGIERLNIPKIMVTDGPHGLRKQSGDSDHIGLNKSVAATCFPTASATASSWNVDLIREMGEALGEECLQEQVGVLLGPGVNIKRSPLCGRNFEYISEDPFLTGVLASAMIDGVQSKGIGTSLKHFAVNNQEYRRMATDSVVDERTLREIYLPGFETAVKKSQPWTVMCAYNMLDGVYCSDNSRLLTDILKNEWGHEGLVVTDWGACNDRVLALKAGMELEMPGSGGLNDRRIIRAVQSGELDEGVLDKALQRILKIILKADSNKLKDYKYDPQKHHDLAKKIALESAVLLKNTDSILPLNKNKKVTFIGDFFKNPRYQGSGSSLINPINLRSAYDAIEECGYEYDFYKGYDIKSDEPNHSLINEAIDAAKKSEIVVIFAGLTEDYESEGFDRVHLDLPSSHNMLIKRVSKVNENVIVVLQNGAPVLMPWLGNVKGLFEAYLGGQAGGEAIVDLLYGNAIPSGKLAETFPLRLEDSPSSVYFPMGPNSVEYREGLYVGYRYFDTFNKEVLFPFGYGLSYTSFEYSNMKLSSNEFNCTDELDITIDIKNIGDYEGSEIVQLYVQDKKSTIHRPKQELKGFKKVWLKKHESKTIKFSLSKRDFAYYNVEEKDWHVESGDFNICLGKSSREIELCGTVRVYSDSDKVLVANTEKICPEYYKRNVDHLVVSDKSFKALVKRELPSNEIVKKGDFTMNSTLGDIKVTFIGKIIYTKATEQFMKMVSEKDEDETTMRMMSAMIEETPLRSLVLMGGGQLTFDTVEGLLHMINGKYFRGIKKLMLK